MHEKVREYIDRKENERLERKKESQRQHLIDLGLFETEYSKDEIRSTEYPCLDEKTYRYYKRIPLEVTDEEYAAICSYDKVDESVSPTGNPIAKALKIVGWIIIIGGFIAGIVFANVYSEFNWGIAIAQWTQSIVSGLMFFGFAEIIKLLQSILNKQSRDI